MTYLLWLSYYLRLILLLSLALGGLAGPVVGFLSIIIYTEK